MAYRENQLKVLIGGPKFMVGEYVQIVRKRFPDLKILLLSWLRRKRIGLKEMWRM
jgi:hypothetical protein